MKRMLMLLAIVFMAGSAQADIVKCIENGKTTFSDKPCPPGAKVIELGIENASPSFATEEKRPPTLSERATAVSKESRLRWIDSEIEQKESRIKSNVNDMNREIDRLQKESATANENKLNAQWQQSLATEMRAISAKYEVENKSLQNQIDALRGERTALLSTR